MCNFRRSLFVETATDNAEKNHCDKKIIRFLYYNITNMTLLSYIITIMAYFINSTVSLIRKNNQPVLCTAQRPVEPNQGLTQKQW